MRGTFWLANAPEKPVQGEFSLDELRVTLAPDAVLINPVIVTQVAENVWSQHELRDHVKRYIIHGHLEDDSKITLVNASREGYPETPQYFKSLTAILGACVTPDDCYSAAKISYQAPWSELVARAHWDEEVDAPGLGNCHLHTSADSLEASWARPVTRTEIERRLVEPLSALLMILTRRRPRVDRFALMLSTGQWVSLLRPTTATENPKVLEEIFSLGEVGATRFKAWLDQTSALNPLSLVVAKSITGPGDLEPRIMALAASAEALERLDHTNAIDSDLAKQLRNVAAGAVAPEYQKVVFDKLGQLADPSFGERFEVLLSRLGPLAGQIAGPQLEDIPNPAAGQSPLRGQKLWIKLVKDSRNGTAHMLVPNKRIDDVDTYAARHHVLLESLGWMMTALMLLRCGLPLAQIQHNIVGPSAWYLSRDRAFEDLPEVYGPFEA
ncbi:hypothetical protein [Kineococcus sp. SYSU DK018]|uniref:hypothetical protein n=1 Tax=Kineococcus sp. SYSU DK018 TaxID=3383139 RepID=UPI003D7D90FD